MTQRMSYSDDLSLYPKLGLTMQIKGKLTHSLCYSSSILADKLGRFHDFGRSTVIARTWSFQGEILRHPNCFIGGSSSANTNLERAGCSRWILYPWTDHPSLATICNLLVVRSPRQQVDNRRVFLTTMWNIPFVSWTISLICGLASHHAPYDFLLCPRPPQSPSRCWNMPILLEVVNRHNSLSIFNTNRISNNSMGSHQRNCTNNFSFHVLNLEFESK